MGTNVVKMLLKFGQRQHLEPCDIAAENRGVLRDRQLAGIDPKREFVATDSTSGIDVLRAQ
jgi:hypothetical protein